MIILIKKTKEAIAWIIKYLIEASEVEGILFIYIRVTIASKLISKPIQIEIQENEEIIKRILNNKIKVKEILNFLIKKKKIELL